MEEPVFGLCALCLQQKQLEKSHYLGRALHLLSQNDGEAVFMTPKRIVRPIFSLVFKSHRDIDRACCEQNSPKRNSLRRLG